MTGRGGDGLVGRYAMLAGADLATKALGFALMMIVVRRFGPAGFGEIGFATSIVTYALVLGACGLDVYAVRVVAGSPEALGGTAGTVVALRLTLALASYATLLVLAAAVPALRAAFGLIALFGLSLFTGAVTLSWVPESLQRTHVLALANLGTQLGAVALLPAALGLVRGPMAVPIAQVTAEALAALGLVLWCHRTFGLFARPLPPRRWAGILARSAPIGGSRVMRAVALGSDLVLLGLLVPMREVGWYGAAYKLFLLGVSAGASFFVIVFPRLVQRAGDPAGALRREVRFGLGCLAAVALPAVALAAVASDWVLDLLFGPSFRAASGPLRLLLLALLANLANNLFRSVLVARGRQTVEFSMAATAAASHVACKLLLIPALGLPGAAMGTLLGELTFLMMTWRAVRADLRGAVPPTERDPRPPDGPFARPRVEDQGEVALS